MKQCIWETSNRPVNL